MSNYFRFQFPNDPSKVSIKSSFPGPAHLEAVQNTPYHGDFEQQHRFINFKKSKGNYFADTDGNVVLDLNAGANGQIVGYNNDDLINARQTELYDRFITHKVDANSLPPNDFADIIRDNVMPAAPQGLN